MKFCSQCGTQMPDDSVFCPKCGANADCLMSYTPAPASPPPAAGLTTAPGPRRRVHPLWIILPAVFAALAAGLVIFLLLSNSPAAVFCGANAAFFEELAAPAADEIGQRMKKEDYEASVVMSVKDVQGADEAAKSMLAGYSVQYDLIRVKDRGGMAVAVNMGDLGLARLTALLTEDTLYGGLTTPGGAAKAARIALPGDKSQPLVERLLALFTGAEPDKRMGELWGKSRDAALQSVDMSWFSIRPGSFTRLADGKTVGATAVTLTMDGKTLKQFVGSFAERLEKDPTFYKDLEEFAAEKLEQAPEGIAENMQESLMELEDSIEEDGFTLEWTAYQAGGKTEAVGIALEIAEPAVSIELLMQNSENAGTKTGAFRLDASVNGQQLSASIDHTDVAREGGSDFSGSFVFEVGGQKVSVRTEGARSLRKKSSNEYEETTEMDVTFEIPGEAGQGAPQGVTLGWESEYAFGDVRFENSRYFDFAGLESTAAEAEDMGEFLKLLSSDALMGNMPFDMDDLTDLPTSQETAAPAEETAETTPPPETPPPAAMPQAIPLATGLSDVFYEFNAKNWFFYSFTMGGPQDNSYAHIDGNSLILPHSDESDISLCSAPITFKKGDAIHVFRTVKFENKNDYLGFLDILYMPAGAEIGSAGMVLETAYNFGPEFYETPSGKFSALKSEGQSIKRLSGVDAVNNEDFCENLIINTATGECVWYAGSEMKDFKIEPLEDGAIVLAMTGYGSDGSGFMRLYNCGVAPYEP